MFYFSVFKNAPESLLVNVQSYEKRDIKSHHNGGPIRSRERCLKIEPSLPKSF